MTGLTRTQLQNWTVEHLHAAASSWNDAADLWENAFQDAHAETKHPGGTEWGGEAADAAQDHSWRDLVHARGSAESLRAAAKIATAGAADIDGARQAALSAIADAESDEFVVGDDLSVSEPPYRQLMRQTATRAAAAQQHADNIGYAANNLMSAENHTSQRLVQAVDFHQFKQDVQDGEDDPYTGARTHKPQAKTPLPPPFDPDTGAAQFGGGPLGKAFEDEIEAVPGAAAATDGTADSVASKLDKYLLNPDHPLGGAKAKWFHDALGFTQENAGDLAKQITFDPAKAVQTEVTQYGTKFNEVIPILGANGKTIDVLFAFIRNNDGIVRLITAIPTKQ